MNHQERLEKLSSGEIKGVRLERSMEWLTQVIATGFLYIGQIARETIIRNAALLSGEKPQEPEPERWEPSLDLDAVQEESDAAEMGLPVPTPDHPTEEQDGDENQSPRRGRPRTKSYPAIESKSGE